MQQYLDLLKAIKERGTQKPPAREGMPGSLSLFGYQFRHNLAEGFPLLTTKQINFKTVVTELLWFLRGNTNIKYLVDNGCNIWNEDAYNYYIKQHSIHGNNSVPLTLEQFINRVSGKEEGFEDGGKNWYSNYTLGDCGFQYGRVWRNWETNEKYWDEEPTPLDKDVTFPDGSEFKKDYMYRKSHYKSIDQIARVIKNLKKNPESRRHLVTAIDPAHDEDLALYWCHAMFQFNCRPLTKEQIAKYQSNDFVEKAVKGEIPSDISEYDSSNTPKYYLDCHLYQRSADVVLGVPFNIASYSLLIHILAKICNMVPGEFIHSFGDVHIYDDHMDAVNLQLSREPRPLPTLVFDEEIVWENYGDWDFDVMEPYEIQLENYNPHPAIKAKLSTGLK